MATAGPRAGSVRSKLIVNTTLALSFIALGAPVITGVALHEWVSFAFCAVLALHILFSWNWIVNVTQRFLSNLRGEIRFNFVWDVALYLTVAAVMVSGLVVSEVALPALGRAQVHDRFWSMAHAWSSHVMLVMVGVHLAMHWNWVTAALRRLVAGTLQTASPAGGARGGWVGPLAILGVVALVFSAASYAVGATPIAARMRGAGAPRPEGRGEAAQGPAATGDAGARSAESGAAVAGAEPRPNAAKGGGKGKRKGAPPKRGLKFKLVRTGKELAVYLGLPFLAALAGITLIRRGQRSAAARDPLVETGE